MDEDFFLYCEDMDVCARVRDAGWDVRFEPRATVHHEGGASRPREELLPMLARNRVLYARKHAGPLAVAARGRGRRARPCDPCARVAGAPGDAPRPPEGARRRSPPASIRGGPLAMCGIAGAFRLDGADAPPLPEHVLRRMTELIEYRGPRRRRLRLRRAAARSAPAGSRSSTSRAATSRSRTRPAASGAPRTARSTTTTCCATSCAPAATCCGAAATPRSCRTSTRTTVLRSPSACAGCSRSPSGTRTSGAA